MLSYQYCFQIETIVRDYGLVVVNRSGSNPHKFIYESDILTKYMVIFKQKLFFKNYLFKILLKLQANIIIVNEWISNEISSTKVRRALCRNESVKFLISELVESYIREHGLYGSFNK